MAVTVTDLTTLSQTDVNTNLALLTQQLQNFNNTIDLNTGVLHDLVLYLQAVLATANNQNITFAEQSNNLLDINQNPALADSATVQAVLSNYNITPSTGTAATGQITIVISTLTPVTIAKGTVFTTNNGLIFTADNFYNARISAGQVIASTDRLLTSTVGGYAFTIGAVANAIGSAYNIAALTTLTMTTPPTSFVTAYANTSFNGGTDASTNAQLLNQLAAGAAVKAWSNKTTNFTLLKNQTEFANILATSEVGYGNAAQLRYHSVLPVAFGGRIDLYVRGQSLYNSIPLAKTATLISKAGNVGTWQFTITSEDAPGMYEVTKITLSTAAANTGGFAITSDVRGWNNTATTFVPDIANALEATYSRYQTATITFVDTTTDATNLTPSTSTNTYTAYVSVMPFIKDIQDFVNNSNTRVCDVLVKAPVPAFTSVSFNINVHSGDPTPNTTNIAIAVANAVNNTSFVSSLNGSTISSAIYTYLSGTQSTVSNMSIVSRIRNADGSNTQITDGQTINVPNSPTIMTTKDTVVFFCSPADVAITIVNV